MSDFDKALEPLRFELELINDDLVDVDEPLSRGVGAEDGVVGLLDTTLRSAGLDLEFDPSRGGEAAKLERRHREENPELAEVLRAFRSVTRLYPDILGTGYGGTREDFSDFRRLIVPQLLEAVGAWARKNGEPEDARKVAKVQKEWEKGVG